MTQQTIPTQKKALDVCGHGCGSTNNRVYRTERFSDSYIVRYHICRGCGRKFKTEEETADK